MRITDGYLGRRLSCLAVGSMAAFALTIGTANAAKGNRDAAMERCIAQAQQAAPDTRTAVYKNCMAQAGYRP